MAISLFLSARVCFQLALVSVLALVVTGAPTSTDEFEYIVVGSGPGGGPLACNLARAGYSTLLLEAGDDQSADLGTLIANTRAAPPNDALMWSFFVEHYSDLNTTLKNNQLTWTFPNGSYWVGSGAKAPAGTTLQGVYYPRGATLGGSSIVNAMATWLPSDSDWNYIRNITQDMSWDATKMREIFERIEHNNYLSEGTDGHGFNGYFQTNLGDGSIYRSIPGFIEILKAQVKSFGKDPEKVEEMLTADGNYLDNQRDWTTGLWGLPFHANDNWERFSSRTYILDTLKATKEDGSKKYPLTLYVNSLVSKVLFDDAAKGKPRAVGVEYLKGVATYKADTRYSSSKQGTVLQALASKEVIISGGAFNSPQLLQLSGIGNKRELEKLGIKVISDLPGVGRNLQDNQEIPIVSLAKTDFTALANNDPVCTGGSEGDPCLPLWREGKGPYTQARSNSNALIHRSKHALWNERDIFMFSGPGAFRGFWPRVSQPELVAPPNLMGFSMVKMHPQNRGYVKLRSTDPTEAPEINFQYYNEGADIDLGALMDTVAWGRRVMKTVPAPYGPLEPAEPPCPEGPAEDGSCGDADRDWIIGQTFGHHPTSTCAIGADNDPLAVLDSKFRVRGVEGLRVVDASVFPRLPGAFPVVATFIVSQKASDTILQERKSGEE